MRVATQRRSAEFVTNAGDEPSAILNKVADGNDSFGYNAATGECGDMVEMGILNLPKITRIATRTRVRK